MLTIASIAGRDRSIVVHVWMDSTQMLYLDSAHHVEKVVSFASQVTTITQNRNVSNAHTDSITTMLARSVKAAKSWQALTFAKNATMASALSVCMDFSFKK